jgi:hypothetical protein
MLAIEHRRREAKAMRDLCRRDVEIGEQQLGGLNVVISGFPGTPSCGRRDKPGGARLSALGSGCVHTRPARQTCESQPPLRSRRAEASLTLQNLMR